MLSAARTRTFLLALLVAICFGLFATSYARASSDEPTGGVQGTLQYKADDPEVVGRVPIVGGEVVVYAAELGPNRSIVELGEEVARGQSDADGKFFVPLESPGDYVVEINLDSLPEGVELVDADRAQLAVSLTGPRALNVLFNLGEEGSASSARNRVSDSTLDRASRLFVEGIKFGLIIGMVSIGLSLIYGTTGLVNFAHSEMITIGAVLTWFINSSLGIHLLIAAPIAMVLGGLLAAGLDRGFWRPLRNRGTGLVAMMIVSIGLAIALRYFVLYLFGDRRQPFEQYAVQRDTLFTIGPIEMIPKDFIMIVISAALLVGVALLLRYTKLGKAMRAVSDNPDLAASTGIDVNKVITVVWFMAGVLVTLGAVFQGLSEQVQWLMGNQLLLLVFAAVTLGGLGTAYGAMVGSLVIGVLLFVSTVWVAPELKNVIALGVMIVLLMVRPQGIFGRRERIG